MLKFMCFLPNLESWASSLHMLTRHLQRLPLTVFQGVHRELATGWGMCLWVSCMEGWESLWASGLWMGFLMGLHPFEVLQEPWMLFSQPFSVLPPSLSHSAP